MERKKRFGRITRARLIIAVCCLAAGCAAGALWFFGDDAARTIQDADTPLGAAQTLMEGDVLTVRVGAPAVSDLYGYQFRLEYDTARFAAGGPVSLVADIPTIFKKDFDGSVLVGATMIGDTPGYTAPDARLCEIELTALTGGAAPDVTLSDVSAVSSELEYTEDISDWTLEIIS